LGKISFTTEKFNKPLPVFVIRGFGENTMKMRKLVTALVSVGSLLLAPCAFAQQELIDPQPEPGEESQPRPSSPIAPEQTPKHPEEAPPKTEAPVPPAITLSTSKPTLQGALLSTSTLLGTPVKTPQGEELGTLQDFMLDPQTGRIVSVVLAFGGTLGVGEKRVTIPWETLTVGISKNELVVEMEKEKLPPAPGGETTQPPAPADH
jgi:sporulation protein YlmC with PRC-barrel domain